MDNGLKFELPNMDGTWVSPRVNDSGRELLVSKSRRVLLHLISAIRIVAMVQSKIFPSDTTATRHVYVVSFLCLCPSFVGRNEQAHVCMYLLSMAAHATWRHHPQIDLDTGIWRSLSNKQEPASM